MSAVERSSRTRAIHLRVGNTFHYWALRRARAVRSPQWRSKPTTKLAAARSIPGDGLPLHLPRGTATRGQWHKTKRSGDPAAVRAHLRTRRRENDHPRTVRRKLPSSSTTKDRRDGQQCEPADERARVGSSMMTHEPRCAGQTSAARASRLWLATARTRSDRPQGWPAVILLDGVMPGIEVLRLPRPRKTDT